MRFASLKISAWQQFDTVDISFHNRMTVLTGPNGCGKTTILNVLAKHSNWESAHLAVPEPYQSPRQWRVPFTQSSPATSAIVVGEVRYDDGHGCNLSIHSPDNQATYGIDLYNPRRVPSFFIPSHRTTFKYHSLSSIEIKNIFSPLRAFEKASENTRQSHQGGGGTSNSYHIKEALLTWSIFGHGNPDMLEQPELLALYRDFERILTLVIPPEVGFQRFSTRRGEVVLVTESGEFLLDASSGGLASIIELAWQLYLFDKTSHEAYTVIVDEIENHLHPSMQRRILPDLLEAFPSACFIVSTHSPLVVGSVRESNVYVLRPNSNHRIDSQLLDMSGEPLTASEVLDEVLGVSVTIPTWAEKALAQIVAKYKANAASSGTLEGLRSDLRSAGLEKFVPSAIVDILEPPNN